MKPVYPFIFFLLLQIAAFAQKEASHFFLDEGIHIDFSQNPPAIDTKGMINRPADFGGTPNASIADKDGRLLFYTNSETIFCADNSVMKGGEQIKGFMCGEDYNSLILPVDQSGYQYYLFVRSFISGQRCPGSPVYFDTLVYYNIIDMRLENGKGAVVIKDIPLSNDNFGTLTAVKHRNGVDTWVVCRKFFPNEYKAFLFTACGIEKKVTSKTPGYLLKSNSLKTLLSPNGKFIASMMVDTIKPDLSRFNDFLYIDYFNDSTGEIISWIKIRKHRAVGVSDFTFSPDSRFIYYENTGLDASQYNISLPDSASVESSEVPLKSDKDYHYFDYFQNLPNGQTLVTSFTSYSDPFTFQGIIEKPNETCPGCFYNPLGLDIPKKKYQFDSTPTYFMSSFFRPGYKTPEPYKLNPQIEVKSRSCANDSSILKGSATDSKTDSLTWLVSDEHNTNLIVYKGTEWKIKLPPGKYTINLTAWRSCVNATTKTIIELETMPEALINGKSLDTVYHCGNTMLAFEANQGAYTYKWSNGDTGKHSETNLTGPHMLETSNTCGTGRATVIIENNQLSVPNVITPNGDNINDTWTVGNKSRQALQVKIINRWGNEIFHSDEYGNEFGKETIDGVYFYTLSQDGGCEEKGWLQVIK